MHALRPYQARGIDTLRRHSAAGRRRLLLVLPTGGGKTVMAGSITKSAREHDARVLFVAHRLELIDQAVKQIAAWGLPHIGVIRADDPRTDDFAPVQVGTIQTLARRLKPKADVVIIDEAHRAMADTYQRLIEWYPEADIIGLTATPCRLDGRGLGDTFEALVQVVQYSELIKEGSIVSPRVFSSRVDVDLSKVHTRSGDYALDELDEVMSDVKIMGSVVEEWKRLSEGRRAVIFACTVEHSKSLVEQFTTAGAKAEHLDGETPIDVRRAILARLNSGETDVVCNVDVLSEGWDQPPVKYLGIARPTQSIAKYMQMGGRVLRPWVRCKVCEGEAAFSKDLGCDHNDFEVVTPIIVDHGRNVDRHGLPHEDRDWDLLSGEKARSERMKLRVCPHCYAYVVENPCELCGHFAPPVERKAIKTDLRAILKERTNDDPRLAFFERMWEQARTKGFKPGAVSFRFKEKYGEWPPWSWSERVKAAFARDEDWQKRQVAREAERAFWKNRERDRGQSDMVDCVDDVDGDDGSLGALVK